MCDKLVKVTIPLAAVRLMVPWRVPLPAARAAVTTELLSLLRRLPNWSSIRMAGCGAKTTPAVAVLGGCVKVVSRLADAGLTTMLPEIAPARVPLLKANVMVSAML